MPHKIFVKPNEQLRYNIKCSALQIAYAQQVVNLIILYYI